MADDELPDLMTIVLRPTEKSTKTLTIPSGAPSLRRSPRKQKAASISANPKTLADVPSLVASSQQRSSPRKQLSPKRAPLKSTQARARKAVEDVHELAPCSRKAGFRTTAPDVLKEQGSDDSFADLLQPLSKLSLQRDLENGSAAQKQNAGREGRSRRAEPTSTMSQITQAARGKASAAGRGKPAPTRSNPYVSREAHCEDLNESSGTEGEDEDTDLSGFVVDDNAELSVCDSVEEVSSDSGDKPKRRKHRQPKPAASARRRLVRGRRKQFSDSEEDADADQGLAEALDGMNLGRPALEKQKYAQKRKTLEVIDLTESSPVQRPETSVPDAESESEQEPEEPRQLLADPFSSFNDALKLQPSSKSQPQMLLPSKMGALPASPKRTGRTTKQEEGPTTPPATPPRSPTKLKSPSKLLSPSKRNAEAPRSTHRQSMDAFWDHNVINEWHDTFSPKKAPTFSPKKNPLARFNLYANDEDLSVLDGSQPATKSSQDPFDESTDSLPSPCESPAKSRSPSKTSALKTEQNRIREEKKAKLAAKRKFDSEKEAIALDLLLALDKHITNSKISAMSASTGGIKVIWSKTLRSTAGRANWRRTVTKPSGSPVKGNPDSETIERQPGVIVQHFASIELAEKIIDRPERLVNTVAHEFCHLANFMVSNIRDQPHGESFKRWGSRVTSWLRSSSATRHASYRAEWKLCEVTTKHSYVIETKYLWACAGRPADRQKPTLTQKMLSIELEDEEGCGAEYGRHSRSIDVEKQRCGRCKGFLAQVRPAPRAQASPKKSPMKRRLRTVMEEEANGSGSSSGAESLERLMEVIDLSD